MAAFNSFSGERRMVTESHTEFFSKFTWQCSENFLFQFIIGRQIKWKSTFSLKLFSKAQSKSLHAAMVSQTKRMTGRMVRPGQEACCP
ncbi:hypothetical protein TNCT_527271 [Trichonephila clavata]|uniref:Uncharacterized protein n=1 Tax=Trichonephila clavata TaxID=2740835 RepID=A0A8X6IER9_TRICU|nr:hypothetical protein TNCT_527271 [Trichonephila clavata]